MLKQSLQASIRSINVMALRKDMPNKISLYLHETEKKELQDLEKIIIYFQSIGYEFVTINRFSKEISSEVKHVAITFDDGFSNWISTLDLFKKYNVKATYFVNTIQFTDLDLEKFLSDIRCDNSDLLINKNELSEIYNNGHEIGAHTHTHKTLSKLNLIELTEEIESNLSILQDLGFDIHNFAIPYGMRRLILSEHVRYLLTKFSSIAYGEAGMLHSQSQKKIQRYPWKVNKSFTYNLNNIKTDTSFFNKITKRSGLG